MLTLIGRTDVPVAVGAATPLQRDLETAPHVHGTSGLEGSDLPAPQIEPIDEDAVSFMARVVSESDEPVTIVPVGPLTNVALFRRRHPDLYDRIDRVVLMGGSLGEGNITPFAEFNIWVDPEAAAEVFGGGRPVTMMGLDVTHQALLTLDDADRMESLGTRTARAFADLLRFFARFHQQKYGWDGAPIHDAVAVGHVALPGLVTLQRHAVEVSLEEDTRGQTSGVPDESTGAVEVGMAIDRRRFVDVLIEAVARWP